MNTTNVLEHLYDFWWRNMWNLLPFFYKTGRPWSVEETSPVHGLIGWQK